MSVSLVRCAGASDRGRVRERNEDRFHHDAELGIFFVIDGMGGQASGDRAAEIASAELRRRLERATGTAEERIREAITLANNAILEEARETAGRGGMECVLTVALVEGERVTVGHVGDTRLYKLRGRTLRKVTRDHSAIGEREERGELTERDAMRHEQRNEVYRSVGGELHTPSDPDFIEIHTERFEPDCALLLCSDGLSDLVESDRIRHLVESYAGDPAGVARELVGAANAAGGRDNVTVVYLEGERFAAAVKGRPAASVVPGLSAASGAPAAATRGVPAPAAPMPAVRRPRRLGTRGQRLGAGLIFLGGVLVGAGIGRLVARPPAGPSDRSERSATAPAGKRLLVGEGRPHTSISGALLAAARGDTVSIAPGEYRECIVLIPGVAVVSEELRGATLRPPAAPGASAIAVLARGISGARISGLRIDGAPAPGFDVGLVIDRSDVVVEDCTIGGARTSGIRIEGPSAPTVRGNEIHGNVAAGISVAAGANPRILHNWVTGNGRGGGSRAPGIDIAAGGDAVIAGNVVAGNGGEGIRGALRTQKALLLRENIFAIGAVLNGGGDVRTLDEAP